MPDLVLKPSEQAALIALLAAEPVPGCPLPDRRVLRLLGRLIPCDGVSAVLRAAGTSSCDLPRPGVRRVEPDGSARAAAHVHSLRIAFRNGPDHAVDLRFVRAGAPFDERDLAVLAMLVPVLRRLVRERPAPQVPGTLTPQERHVLALVAAGLSNAEIADRISVTCSTVRKHLEHAYRKLGVSSRVGAVAALHGCDEPGIDLRERLERFA